MGVTARPVRVVIEDLIPLARQVTDDTADCDTWAAIERRRIEVQHLAYRPGITLCLLLDSYRAAKTIRARGLWRLAISVLLLALQEEGV